MAIVLSLTNKQHKALMHLLNYSDTPELMEVQAKLLKGSNAKQIPPHFDVLTSALATELGTVLGNPSGEPNGDGEGSTTTESVSSASSPDGTGYSGEN